MADDGSTDPLAGMSRGTPFSFGVGDTIRVVDLDGILILDADGADGAGIGAGD